MPLIYKFTSVWGNHEGSMLLWVLILSLFGALVAVFGANLPATLRANVLAVQSWIAAAFYLFILATSNPFARLAPAPFEGRDLNPLLQDIGLAIHPPLLYLGYVGFSISFSFAIAALIEGQIDAAWARWVRPWTLAAWCFLTVGIAMGSYWAYYELGWGGWWFWDPVENASFMPWLVGTALLHSAIVMEKRDALKIWTILLAILAFSLSLLGTFLVRSGVLTSVHSLRDRPDARRVHPRDPGAVHRRLPRALCLAGAAAQAGRPVRADLPRGRARPQQPLPHDGVRDRLYRHALSARPRGAHRSEDLGRRALLQPDLRAADPAAARRRAVRAVAGLEARRPPRRRPAPVRRPRARARRGGGELCDRRREVHARALRHRARLLRHGRRRERARRADAALQVPAASALARARGLPRSAWGNALAHFGLGVSLLGIVCETHWGAERIASVKPGQTLELRGYELRFDGLEQRQGPNYRELAGRFTVRRDGETIAVMEPAKRSFPARENATTEAAIMTRGFSQLYLSLGDAGRRRRDQRQALP